MAVSIVTRAPSWWTLPELRQVWPYVRVLPSGAGARFELASNTPENLRAFVVQFVAPCAACGSLIHPFRAREGDPLRGNGHVAAGVYVSVSCPLAVRVRCSRTRAASAAYGAIAEMIEDAKAGRLAPAQAGFFFDGGSN